MYDVFSIELQNFGFSETTDFRSFANIGHFNDDVMKTTNFTSPKHGSVIQLTKEEATKLAEHYYMKLEF